MHLTSFDFRWVTSSDNVSLGRTWFALGMFYYCPKIYSQLNFHLSEHAARKLHAELQADRVMLVIAVQLASKYWLTLKCVNHQWKSFTWDP